MVRALWLTVVLLAVLGVAAALGRTVFVADFVHRADPVRSQILTALGRTDPLALQRPAELDRFDRRFGDHPLIALLHIVPGGLFLALAPLQFVARVRTRYVALHRWSGRVLIVLGLASALGALFFGVLIPFGGAGEAAAIALFAGLFLFSVVRAFAAIRRRQVARHREWMIRAFAIAIGISTVRVVGVVLDVVLTPAAVGPDAIFVLSIWTGWIFTAGAAEIWIRCTRAPTAAVIASDRRAAVLAS